MGTWPTPQDYNEAIQGSPHCFSDPDLKKGVVAVNALGIPRVASGAFASVYKVTHADKSWAVRFFHSNRTEQKERYRHISDFVLFDNLESTIDFYYLDEGIKVRGIWYPCLKMVWVDGPTLDRYIDEHHHDQKKMSNLLREFHKLVGELEGAGIGHCDLQHGNIIVSDEGLRLVDYDALFVPALAGRESLEFGHPNYQHPERQSEHYDQDVDNFSCWLIHTSLLCLAIDPSLYKTLAGGDDSIIFKRTDLQNPEGSVVFQTLLNHDSDHIRDAVLLMMRMLWASPTAIPYLGAPLKWLESLPSQRSEPTKRNEDDDCIIGNDTTFDTQGALGTLSESPAHSAMTDVLGSLESHQKKRRQHPDRIRKSLVSAFDRGRRARDKVLKVADRVQQGTVPYNWFHKHYKRAEDLYCDGEYHAAIQVLQKIFKSIYTNEFWIKNRAYHRYQVPMMLGYCHVLDGSTALAGNYFLTALNAAQDECPHRSGAAQSTLLLALSKYEEGDRIAAWRTLHTYGSFLTGIAALIRSMDNDPLVFRPSTFKMLKEFAEQINASEAKKTVSTQEVLAAATEIFVRLLDSKSNFVDAAIVDEYMDVLRYLYRTEHLDKAKTGFLHLAKRCYGMGLMSQARVSLFCGAFISHRLRKDKKEYLKLLAELGKVNADELLGIATASDAFFPANEIVGLLIAIANTFKTQGAGNEQVDALRVACRFSMNRQTGSDLIVTYLESETRSAVLSCLEATFVSESRSATEQESTPFLVAVVESKCSKVASCVFDILEQRKDLNSMAVLLHFLARSGDPKMLVDTLAGKSGDANRYQYFMQALALTTYACYIHMDTWKEAANVKPVDMDVLVNLSMACREIGLSEQSDVILMQIASDKYQHFLCNWAIDLVGAGDYNRLYKLIQLLADKQHDQALKSIVIALVNTDRTAAADGIAKVINNQAQRSLFALAAGLNDAKDLKAFTLVSTELVRTAKTQVLIALIDNLSRGKSDSIPARVAALSRALIRNGRASDLAHVLSHCHRTCGLSFLSLIADDLFKSTSSIDVFIEMIKEEDWQTLEEIVNQILFGMPLNRLNQLFNILSAPTVDPEALYIVLRMVISKCNRELETLVELVKNEATPSQQACAGGLPSIILVENTSDSIMESMDINPSMERGLLALLSLVYLRHNLRRPKHSHLQLDETNEVVDGMSLQSALELSLSDRYSQCRTWSGCRLARQNNLSALKALVLEICLYEMSECLADLGCRLADDGHHEILRVLTDSMVENKELSKALYLAFRLAKVGQTFAARVVTTEILKKANNQHALTFVVQESAIIDVKLTDMIIRQVANNNTGMSLKAAAETFAREGNDKALYLVLNQLASTDTDFPEFVARLCDSVREDRIQSMIGWLITTGMSSVVRDRVNKLRKEGKAEAANMWAAFLPH